MARDKQLSPVELSDVLEKRRLDQALNAKEFAVLVGISYSTAREWFRLPGFPVFRGVVFWGDFVGWRRVQAGLTDGEGKAPPVAKPTNCESAQPNKPPMSARAARILSEAS